MFYFYDCMYLFEIRDREVGADEWIYKELNENPMANFIMHNIV